MASFLDLQAPSGEAKRPEINRWLDTLGASDPSPRATAAPEAETKEAEEFFLLDGDGFWSRNMERGGRQLRQTTYALGVAGGLVDPDIAAEAIAQDYRNSPPPDPALQEFADAEGILGKLGAWAKYPARLPAAVGLESSVSSAPMLGMSLSMGAAGAAFGGVGAPIGGAVGAFTGSMVVETGAQILSELADAGVRMDDPAELAKAFRNPELMAKAQDVANRKALGTSIFEAAGALIALRPFKALGGALDKAAEARKQAERLAKSDVAMRTARTLGSAAKELGIQAGEEASGEAAGQLLAGKDLREQGDELFLEALGGVGMSSPNVALGMYLRNRQANKILSEKAASAGMEQTAEAIGRAQLEVDASVAQQVRELESELEEPTSLAVAEPPLEPLEPLERPYETLPPSMRWGVYVREGGVVKQDQLLEGEWPAVAALAKERGLQPVENLEDGSFSFEKAVEMRPATRPAQPEETQDAVQEPSPVEVPVQPASEAGEAVGPEVRSPEEPAPKAEEAVAPEVKVATQDEVATSIPEQPKPETESEVIPSGQEVQAQEEVAPSPQRPYAEVEAELLAKLPRFDAAGDTPAAPTASMPPPEFRRWVRHHFRGQVPTSEVNGVLRLFDLQERRKAVVRWAQQYGTDSMNFERMPEPKRAAKEKPRKIRLAEARRIKEMTEGFTKANRLRFQANNEKLRKTVRAEVARMQRDGELAGADPEELVSQAVSHLGRSLRNWIRDNPEPVEGGDPMPVHLIPLDIRGTYGRMKKREIVGPTVSYEGANIGAVVPDRMGEGATEAELAAGVTEEAAEADIDERLADPEEIADEAAQVIQDFIGPRNAEVQNPEDRKILKSVPKAGDLTPLRRLSQETMIQLTKEIENARRKTREEVSQLRRGARARRAKAAAQPAAGRPSAPARRADTGAPEAQPAQRPDEQGAARLIWGAYRKNAEASNSRTVYIADIARESGVPLARVHEELVQATRAGQAVLSTGDWASAPADVREAAIPVGQPNERAIQIRLLNYEPGQDLPENLFAQRPDEQGAARVAEPSKPTKAKPRKSAPAKTEAPVFAERIAPENLGVYRQAEQLKALNRELEAAKKAKPKSEAQYAMFAQRGVKSKAALIRAIAQERETVINGNAEDFADVWQTALEAADAGRPVPVALVESLRKPQAEGGPADLADQLDEALRTRGFRKTGVEYTKPSTTPPGVANAPAPANISLTREFAIQDDYIPELAEYTLQPGASLGEALRIVGDSDSPFAPLARDLLGIASPADLEAPLAAKAEDAKEPNRSTYDPVTRAIAIGRARLGGTLDLMHEAVHALTLAKIPADLSGLGKLTGAEYIAALRKAASDPKVSPPVRDLVNLYLEAADKAGVLDKLVRGRTGTVSRIGYAPLANRPDDILRLEDGMYGFSNLAEFLAESFSSPAFQEKLSSMWSRDVPDASVWDLLLDAIANILGLKIPRRALLRRVIRAGAEIMESPDVPGFRAGMVNAPSSTKPTAPPSVTAFPPEATDAERNFIWTRGIEGALEQVAENKAVPAPLRALAKAFRKLNFKGAKLVYGINPRLKDYGRPHYDSDSHTIFILPGSRSDDAGLAHVILHEAIHALLLPSLDNYVRTGGKGLTRRQLSAIREMDRVFRAAEQQLAAKRPGLRETLLRRKAGKPLPASEENRLYGLLNLNEFASEALTSASFKGLLASLPDPAHAKPSKVRSLWESFLAAMEAFVMASLGVAPGEGTLLRGAVSSVLNAIDALQDTAPVRGPPASRSFRVGNAVIRPPDSGTVAGFPVGHASPHEFDRFTTEKIGTGEGGAAYGWGLYFAENPETVESYYRTFSRKVTRGDINARVLLDQQPLNPNILEQTKEEQIALMLAWETHKTKKSVEEAREHFAKYYAKASREAESSADSAYFAETQAALDNFDARRVRLLPEKTASKYTVDLDLKDSETLLWDEPIGRQHPEVQRKIAEVSKGIPEWFRDPTLAASNWYQDLVAEQPGSRREGKKAVSLALDKAGIKGIKYADAGSRFFTLTKTADGKFFYPGYSERFDTREEAEAWADANPYKPQKTYNYVVFDENRIRILDRNGKRIEMQEARAESSGPPISSATSSAPGVAAAPPDTRSRRPRLPKGYAYTRAFESSFEALPDFYQQVLRGTTYRTRTTDSVEQAADEWIASRSDPEAALDEAVQKLGTPDTSDSPTMKGAQLPIDHPLMAAVLTRLAGRYETARQEALKRGDSEIADRMADQYTRAQDAVVERSSIWGQEGALLRWMRERNPEIFFDREYVSQVNAKRNALKNDPFVRSLWERLNLARRAARDGAWKALEALLVKADAKSSTQNPPATEPDPLASLSPVEIRVLRMFWEFAQDENIKAAESVEADLAFIRQARSKRYSPEVLNAAEKRMAEWLGQRTKATPKGEPKGTPKGEPEVTPEEEDAVETLQKMGLFSPAEEAEIEGFVRDESPRTAAIDKAAELAARRAAAEAVRAIRKAFGPLKEINFKEIYARVVASAQQAVRAATRNAPRRAVDIGRVMQGINIEEIGRQAFEAAKLPVIEAIQESEALSQALKDEAVAKVEAAEYRGDQKTRSDVARLIKEGLEAQATSVSSLVREHMDKQKATVEGLIRDLLARTNLTPDQARKLAAVVHATYNDLARKSASAQLKSILERSKNKKARKLLNKTQRLANAAQLGALDENVFTDEVAKALDIPVADPEFRAEIKRQGLRMKAMPENSVQRRSAAIDLLTMIHHRLLKDSGARSATALLTSVWKAGVLSGPETQAVNFGFTSLNVLLDSITAAAAMAPKGQKFRYAVQAITGLAHGIATEGWVEAQSALFTGRTKFLSEKLSPDDSLEMFKLGGRKEGETMGSFLGRQYPAALKLVRRTMGASDALNSGGAYGAIRRLLAYDYKKGTGATDEETRAWIDEVFENPDFRNRAEAQAAEEDARGDFGPAGDGDKHKAQKRRHDVMREQRILELIEHQQDEVVGVDPATKDGLDELAKAFAAKATFNEEGHGFFGMLMGGVAEINRRLVVTQALVPFTRILANLMNVFLDWSPYGLVRAKGYSFGNWVLEASGSKDTTHRFVAPAEGSWQQEQLRMKAFVGSLVWTAAMLLFAKGFEDDEKDDPEWLFCGSGPSDPAKLEQLQLSGFWQRNSIGVKIGGKRHWLKFQDWAAFGPFFAILGNISDSIRYGSGDKDLTDKIWLASLSIPSTLLDKNMLQGAGQFFEAIRNPNARGVKAWQRMIAGTTSGFTNPSALRWVNKVFTGLSGQAQKERRTNEGFFYSITPVAGYVGKPRLNVLGEPVVPEKYSFLYGRFGVLLGAGAREFPDHPVLKPLLEAGVFVPPPGLTTKIVKVENGVAKQTSMNNEEFYIFAKGYGEQAKKILTPSVIASVRKMAEQDQDRAQEYLENLIRPSARAAGRAAVYRQLRSGADR